MPKLTIVISALDIGGAQRFCLNFGRYLKSINYDYEIVFIRKMKENNMKHEFDRYNIKYTELGASSVMRGMPRLIKYLNAKRPDVLLSTIDNVDFMTSIACIVSRKTKLIIRKANVIFDNNVNLYTRAQLLIESKICSGLVALTEEMANDFLQYGFKKDKIIVINNMVDLNYVKRRYSEDCERHPWFTGTENPIVVANARFVQEKRYDILIQAFIKLKQNIKNARLMILGDGELRDSIHAMIPNELKETVAFLGFQNNPYYFMHNSDVFVLTSDYEGFPNVIIEAFACGLPVVATNCKSGPKEIITNEKDGYVVPVGDAESVADKLEKIIRNPELRSIMSENAISKAQEYSLDYIGHKYLDLFNKISSVVK